ncbi:MAG: response regulator transcription factor [Spirochaetes bacterium]|nr:response regulator transcription factor [Spirochaetota bacterium]
MREKKSSSFEQTKILLVEDHPIFRKGLKEIINNQPGMVVIGECSSAREAYEIVRTQKPKLAIIDISLKDSNGIALIKEIRQLSPETLVLVLSMHDEHIYAERALRAGARGYVMKHQPPEVVIDAINHILDGKIFVSDDIATKIFTHFIEGLPAHRSPIDLLSDRELEVFELIGQGLGTRQIAERLGVSAKTVENHRAHIKEKMNFTSAIELIQHATLWVQKK